ncbi:hypothetical protein BH10BDE1_BH10BDE1_29780 [soil metagenome]
MKLRVWGLAGTLVAAALLVFAFQNCSQPMPVDSAAAAAAAAAKIDFAYDATIDQISYMSCAVAEPGTYDGGAYFSYRFGSYRGTGLRINDTFRAANNKKPVEKQAELLTESPANTNTNVQFSIRQLANFQVMYTATGTSVAKQDYVNVLEPLGTLDLSDLLVRIDPTARIKYLRNGSVFGSRMEGSLYFTKNPTLANSIRTALRNDAMLAQTYSHMADGSTADTLARSPHDVVEGSASNPYTQVYGRGYNLKFAQPTVGATAANANFPNVIMNQVSEMNLTSSSDRSGLSTWTCPDTLRFRIVRPEDIKALRVTCAMAPDPAILTQDLSIVRNQLRVEDWYVDMTNKCIVPKKAPATCYGSGVTTVQYDITQACSEGVDAACVSFASVCYRQ